MLCSSIFKLWPLGTYLNFNAKFLSSCQSSFICEGDESNFVQGIGCIGYQLSQENLKYNDNKLRTFNFNTFLSLLDTLDFFTPTVKQGESKKELLVLWIKKQIEPFCTRPWIWVITATNRNCIVETLACQYNIPPFGTRPLFRSVSQTH